MEFVVSGVSGGSEGAPGRGRVWGGICKRKAGGRLLWGRNSSVLIQASTHVRK